MLRALDKLNTDKQAEDGFYMAKKVGSINHSVTLFQQCIISLSSAMGNILLSW